MSIFRRFLACALLFSLALLSGCELFSSDAWQRPSPLSGRPPPPPERQERQGGFTVLVGAPGQPTAPQVVADLGKFAQSRGFVRLFANSVAASDPVAPAPERYALGDIRLDVTYRTADLRVVASLHSASSKLNDKFIDQFSRDFHQQYAGGYGEVDPISESDYVDDSGNPFTGGGGSGGGGSRGGRGGR